MEDLYARAISLRNCGRFTHVSSDFGSQYQTHTFVTSEALYASLTRGVTWRHASRFVDLEEDARKSLGEDYFLCDYDVAQKPIWFTPGLFVDDNGEPLMKSRETADRTDFNVVSEGYPSTGGGGRPAYVPTYGTIESILPNHRMLAYAFSRRPAELDAFRPDQTFLLGKKRAMFQIVGLSEVVQGQWCQGQCTTSWLELPSSHSLHFDTYTILAATMRYLIIQGQTRQAVAYVQFDLPDTVLRLPDFYLERVPIMTA